MNSYIEEFSKELDENITLTLMEEKFKKFIERKKVEKYYTRYHYDVTRDLPDNEGEDENGYRCNDYISMNGWIDKQILLSDRCTSIISRLNMPIDNGLVFNAMYNVDPVSGDIDFDQLTGMILYNKCDRYAFPNNKVEADPSQMNKHRLFSINLDNDEAVSETVLSDILMHNDKIVVRCKNVNTEYKLYDNKTMVCDIPYGGAFIYQNMLMIKVFDKYDIMYIIVPKSEDGPNIKWVYGRVFHFHGSEIVQPVSELKFTMQTKKIKYYTPETRIKIDEIIKVIHNLNDQVTFLWTEEKEREMIERENARTRATRHRQQAKLYADLDKLKDQYMII